MRIILVAMLALQMSAFTLPSSPEDCIDDARAIVNDLRRFIASITNDPLNPDLSELKAVLGDMTDFSTQCIGRTFHFDNYDVCVDLLAPVFPLIQNIQDDLANRDIQKFIADAQKLANILNNQVSPCFNNPTVELR